jgi:hypothetical protein
MSISIIDYKDIDINRIRFSSPEKSKGSYYSFAQYDGKDIYIKTPMLTNLSNIVKLDTRCYIELDIDTSDKEISDFYDFFSNLDDNNILTIHKESTNWFKKEFPLDVVEDFYTTPLKHKNSPKLKLKIPLIKTKVDCLIYDKNNTIITDFNKNNKLICVLKFGGLKFLSQQVISEWIPIQIKINEVVDTHNIEYLIQDNFIDTAGIATEPEHTEPEHTEPEHTEPEHTEPEHTEPEHTEPEHTETEHTEPEHTEPEHTEPEHTEPEHTEPEHTEPEHTEPEHTEPEHTEPEHTNNSDTNTNKDELLTLRLELTKYKKLFYNNQTQLDYIKKMVI